MCQNQSACGVYGIDISLFAVVDILEHNGDLSAHQHFFQHFRLHADLHKSFGICPCHTDILHHDSLCDIYLRLLHKFDGRVLHDDHKSIRLVAALHVKADVGINGAAGDDAVLVNNVQLIDHQTFLDRIELLLAVRNGRVHGKHVREGSRFGETVLTEIVCELCDGLLIVCELFLDICELGLTRGCIGGLADDGLQNKDGCDRDQQRYEHVGKQPIGKYFFHSIEVPSFLGVII